jgi:preprotein translocase subunit SecY
MAALVVLPLIVAGLFCLSVVRWAPVFDSCRVFYRIHNVVDDSLRCHVFSALNVATIVLFVVATIAALAWSYLFLHVRRNDTANS